LRNVYLPEETTREIDTQVAKLLRGLGKPEPPLNLEAVFALQRLDPQFYRKRVVLAAAFATVM